MSEPKSSSISEANSNIKSRGQGENKKTFAQKGQNVKTFQHEHDNLYESKNQLQSFNINSAGYGMIPKLVMQDRNLPIIAKAIYSYFCSFTGAGNTCFPSRKKICFDLQINLSTYKKHMKVLIENGYLKVEQIKENGKFARNLYTLVDTITPRSKNQVYEPENGDFTAFSPRVVSPTATKYTTKSNIDKINKPISLSKKVRKANDENFSKKTEVKKSPPVEPETSSKENACSTEPVVKKLNQGGKETLKSFDSLIDDYTENENLRKELKEHLKTRKLKKAALSNRAVELSLKKLDQLAGSDEEKILIVQNAIMNGWTTFYPLKADEKKQLNDKTSYNLSDYEKTMDTIDEYDGFYGTVIT